MLLIDKAWCFSLQGDPTPPWDCDGYRTEVWRYGCLVDIKRLCFWQSGKQQRVMFETGTNDEQQVRTVQASSSSVLSRVDTFERQVVQLQHTLTHAGVARDHVYESLARPAITNASHRTESNIMLSTISCSSKLGVSRRAGVFSTLDRIPSRRNFWPRNASIPHRFEDASIEKQQYAYVLCESPRRGCRCLACVQADPCRGLPGRVKRHCSDCRWSYRRTCRSTLPVF